MIKSSFVKKIDINDIINDLQSKGFERDQIEEYLRDSGILSRLNQLQQGIGPAAVVDFEDDVVDSIGGIMSGEYSPDDIYMYLVGKDRKQNILDPENIAGLGYGYLDDEDEMQNENAVKKSLRDLGVDDIPEEIGPIMYFDTMVIEENYRTGNFGNLFKKIFEDFTRPRVPIVMYCRGGTSFKMIYSNIDFLQRLLDKKDFVLAPPQLNFDQLSTQEVMASPIVKVEGKPLMFDGEPVRFEQYFTIIFLPKEMI
jgi:hypothetical protein